MPKILPETCRLCHKTREAHDGVDIKHQFVGLSEAATLRKNDAPQQSVDQVHPEPQGPVRSLTGGDPILRMALIRAGIITADQLAAVEAELKGVGIAVAEPALGQPRSR